MPKIRVAVLRGGPSNEYEVSLKTGRSVIDNMPAGHIPTDVFISKDGVWHIDGAPMPPEKALRGADVVFNALHGAYGEDGKLQRLLDLHQMPYTGSRALASAIAMNKVMAKELYMSAGLKTPVFKVFKRIDITGETPRTLFKSFPMPAIVKPADGGSSVGIAVVRTVAEIARAIDEALAYAETVIVEEFIAGKEATCGVIEDFKGRKLYPLLPVEIAKPDGSTFFDYAAKYSGASREICPGNFSKKETEAIEALAVNAHEVLGLSHYSRSDFIVHPRRGVYILETNTLPGLTAESLLPKELAAVGATLPQFIEHVIRLALERK